MAVHLELLPPAIWGLISFTASAQPLLGCMERVLGAILPAAPLRQTEQHLRISTAVSLLRTLRHISYPQRRASPWGYFILEILTAVEILQLLQTSAEALIGSPSLRQTQFSCTKQAPVAGWWH
jgi:hypothetical protein